MVDNHNQFSLETVREVWDDKTGDHFEIGPDRDSTGNVEIRLYTKESLETVNRIFIPKEAAPLIAQALLDCHKEITKTTSLS